MTNIKLTKMVLRNFQGIKSLEINFDGDNANIYGDNGTGKTTIANAFMWCLFNKPMSEAKDYTPKTKTATGEMHKAAHSVEVTLDNNGANIALKKVYREKYANKRGGVTEEFTGHTTDYFINDIPTKESDYASQLEAFLGVNLSAAALISNIGAFPALNWEMRRKLLFKCCGEFDETKLLSTSDFAELNDRLSGKYSVDEYKVLMKSKQAEYKKELQSIPARIDELMNQQASAPDIDRIRDQLSFIQSQINDTETERTNAIVTVDNTAFDELTKVQNKLEGYRGLLAKKQLERERSMNEVTQLSSERNKLLSEWKTVYNSQFDEQAGVCPTCEQSLPAEVIESAKQAFEAEKATKLKDIEVAAQSCNISIINEKQEAIKDLECSIKETEYTVKELRSEVQQMQANIKERNAEQNNNLLPFDTKLAELKQSQLELIKNLSIAEAAESCAKRIEELKENEKAASAAYEDSSLGLYLCSEFEKAKSEYMTEQINRAFETVKFKLFKEQVNGDMKEACDILIPSAEGNLVPYGIANTAATINAGIEICSVLSKCLTVTMPLFIDNAESVTHIKQSTAQTIRLIVSERDKILKIEKE